MSCETLTDNEPDYRNTQKAMERIYISNEGLEKLKADLDQCNERRMKVAKKIEEARGFGDLSENAEYHSAKEEQAMLHAKIRDLEHNVASAVILDDTEIDASKAYLGASVKVLNKKTNSEFEYILVSHVEADLASGKISVQSPVGKALLGKSVGDVAIANVPAGDIKFEILDIKR